MAPATGTKSARIISQEAFDELVKENIEDLGMDPTEALQDAIHTLSLQGVDLSGIVKLPPGEGTAPVLNCLDSLKRLLEPSSEDRIHEDEELVEGLFRKFIEESRNSAAVAVTNGGIPLLCSLCSKIPPSYTKALVSAFKALSLLLYDLHGREVFRSSGGTSTLVRILEEGSENSDILDSGFVIVAVAATGNEVVKESFMELGIDELILCVLSREREGSVPGVYDAIRVLLTPDDNRVVASQVYGYARRFAKIGIAEALVESLKKGLNSASLVSACIALKAIAVNEEICNSIAESGGIDVILECVDRSGQEGNKIVARTCCSLLSKIAGSDCNKSAIVEKGGLNRLIQLSARFSDDSSVLQEVMTIFTVVCLRSPENAARAMEAGAGDLIIQAMQKFPTSQQVQRNSCLVIRNLVVRNPENRTLLLSQGIERLIRKAKEDNESCKDAASDALRDLGLDNYNT